MIRPTLVAGISVLMLTVSVPPRPAAAQGKRDRIRVAADSLLRELHERGWFNGAVVLGTDEEIYANGFGLPTSNETSRSLPDVPAEGASIAKTLTTAVACDLFRWSRSFYTTPALSRRALQRGSSAALLQDSIRKQGGYSRINLLSWYYAPEGDRFHYPGALQGFWSSSYRDEKRKYSVVYMSNNSMPQWLRPLLTRALIEIMEGRPAPVIDEPRDLAITKEDVPEFAGTYAVAGIGRVRLSDDGVRVFVSIGSGIMCRAFFVEDRQLYVPGLDVWLAFPADDVPFARIRWSSIFHTATGSRTKA